MQLWARDLIVSRTFSIWCVEWQISMNALKFQARIIFPPVQGLHPRRRRLQHRARIPRAAGLTLSEGQLSRLARRGSGSASRSIPSGFVEWMMGTGDDDCVCGFKLRLRTLGLDRLRGRLSTQVTRRQFYRGARACMDKSFTGGASCRCNTQADICRNAILTKDFETFANIIEHDSDMMHAVMMTSNPPLMYWQSATVEIFIKCVAGAPADSPSLHGGCGCECACDLSGRVCQRSREASARVARCDGCACCRSGRPRQRSSPLKWACKTACGFPSVQAGGKEISSKQAQPPVGNQFSAERACVEFWSK